MNVLITGCNGLIACRLSKKLLEQNVDVVGLSENGLTNPYLDKSRYIQADLRDFSRISALLNELNPDIIVHCAAITKPDVCELNPELCDAVNFEAAKHLLNEAQKKNIYCIHLSTDFVFAGAAEFHDELSTDFPPVNRYGKSKYELEKYIVAHHPQAAVVRTALVYGIEPLLPRNNIFTWALEQLQKENIIRVVNDQYRMPTFADDLATGIVQLCTLKKSGIYHLAGADFMSVYEFVRQIAGVFQLNKQLIIPVETASLNEPAKRPASTRLQITKAQNEIGYAPNSTVYNLNLLLQSL